MKTLRKSNGIRRNTQAGYVDHYNHSGDEVFIMQWHFKHTYENLDGKKTVVNYETDAGDLLNDVLDEFRQFLFACGYMVDGELVVEKCDHFGDE